MGLIRFHYVGLLILSLVGMLAGAIDYASREQYIEAAALVLLPLPAGYVVASITPWVRNHMMRKLIATPLLAITLFFAFAHATHTLSVA